MLTEQTNFCFQTSTKNKNTHFNSFMVKPQATYEYIRVTYKWMTYEYIRVTYGWHTSTYEWQMNDIRVHTSDIRMTYEWDTSDIRMTNEWHTSDIRMTFEWYTNDIGIHSAWSFSIVVFYILCGRNIALSGYQWFSLPGSWPKWDLNARSLSSVQTL